MKIAVVGSGISGLSAAYYLSKNFHVDLFEQNDHFGGHSFTYEIQEDNKTLPVDLGFIVFNKETYPNLIKFFHDLNVNYEKSDMSFSVSIKNTNIEYSGKGLNTIFANRSNIINLRFLKMIWEIISFYKSAPSLQIEFLKNETLGSYLNKIGASKYFIDYHIIPMVAAIWSMPFTRAKEMPLKLFLNFFSNHGLFKFQGRPQWYTVSNRSRDYVNKVLKNISGEVYKNYKVNKISRNKDNIKIFFGNDFLNYDRVILATHSNQSLDLIENPTEDEKNILSKFNYITNKAFLHSDERLMPKRKITWSSWNSLTLNGKTCITYWLNKLQNLKTNKNYFLTLNPYQEIKKENLIKKIDFEHPFFNLETMKLQESLNTIQGQKNTWFCGAYFGYGFHEDGLKSSLKLLKSFEL